MSRFLSLCRSSFLPLFFLTPFARNPRCTAQRGFRRPGIKVEETGKDNHNKSLAPIIIQRISIGNAVYKYRCHRQYRPFVARRKISILQMSIFAPRWISVARSIDASIRYALRRMRVNERYAPFAEHPRSRGPIVVRQLPRVRNELSAGTARRSRGPGEVR